MLGASGVLVSFVIITAVDPEDSFPAASVSVVTKLFAHSSKDKQAVKVISYIQVSIVGEQPGIKFEFLYNLTVVPISPVPDIELA